jgi:hypothetical protein
MLRARTVAVAVTVIGSLVAAVGPVARVHAADLSGPPRVSIGGGSVLEGNMNRRWIRFTVTVSWPSTSTITVQYATGDPGDSATADVDYRSKAGLLTFLPGQQRKAVGVVVWEDHTVEPDETFSLKLLNPMNATLGYGTATGTIHDDDPPASGNRVSLGDGTSPEICAGRGANATLTVALGAPAGGLVVVTVTTSAITATPGLDYVETSRTISLFPGNLVKPFVVRLLPDLEAEGAEQVRATLTVVSGPLPAGRTEATITILDCDPPA